MRDKVLLSLFIAFYALLGLPACAAPTRYEAEQASTNLPTETRWSGYSGTSYLCCWSSSGQFATFSVNAPVAGIYTLAFGYSAGNGVASRRLTVNGTVTVANQTFSATANWSTWAKLTKTVTLHAGANTVKLDFTSSSSKSINLDYLDVTPPVLPSSVSLTPSSVSAPNNSVAWLVLSQPSVIMSDGSAFAGVLAVSGASFVTITNGKVVLSRALTAADNGLKNLTVTATQNGASATATLALTVTVAATSPDGYVSTPPNGPSLTAASGVWTWGDIAGRGAGEYNVNLNGSATGIATLMEVANGGRLYANTANAGWYVWQNSAWANASQPPISPDGTTSAAPNGSALNTADGLWMWASAASGRPGEYNINLNGVDSTGVGALMEVANGGRLYTNTANLGWYVWQNSAWSNASQPPISPDGTTSAAPNGSALNTADGLWMWASAASGRPGEYNINLNGVDSAGVGTLMETANQGSMYVNTSSYGWYLWQSGVWVNSGAPASPVSIILSPVSATIPDNSPAGTLVSTASVTMSDNSQYHGTLTLDNTNFFSVSGMSIITARPFTAADDGARSATITAN